MTAPRTRRPEQRLLNRFQAYWNESVDSLRAAIGVQDNLLQPAWVLGDANQSNRDVSSLERDMTAGRVSLPTAKNRAACSSIVAAINRPPPVIASVPTLRSGRLPRAVVAVLVAAGDMAVGVVAADRAAFPNRAGGGIGGIALVLVVGFMHPPVQWRRRRWRSWTTSIAAGRAKRCARPGRGEAIGGSGVLTTEGSLPPEVQQLLAAFGANQFASGSVQEISQPAAPIAPAATIASAPASAVAGADTAGGDTWTILLYQDADDQVLEQDIHIDLNEAERATQSPNVNVIAQSDRFRGGLNGDGNVTRAKRYLVRHDEHLPQ